MLSFERTANLSWQLILPLQILSFPSPFLPLGCPFIFLGLTAYIACSYIVTPE